MEETNLSEAENKGERRLISTLQAASKRARKKERERERERYVEIQEYLVRL